MIDMKAPTRMTPSQRLLVGHGALLIFVGGIIGFGWLFFLIGKIALWPIPGEIAYQMPGTYDAWRMAHMEGITNGLLLWLTAALLPIFPFSENGRKRIAWSTVIIGWSIVLAAAIKPIWPDSPGLEFGGPLTNNIAFFLFYIGVPGVMILMAAIAWRCMVPRKEDE